jgi:hypothetical protein
MCMHRVLYLPIIECGCIECADTRVSGCSDCSGGGAAVYSDSYRHGNKADSVHDLSQRVAPQGRSQMSPGAMKPFFVAPAITVLYRMPPMCAIWRQQSERGQVL